MIIVNWEDFVGEIWDLLLKFDIILVDELYVLNTNVSGIIDLLLFIFVWVFLWKRLLQLNWACLLNCEVFVILFVAVHDVTIIFVKRPVFSFTPFIIAVDYILFIFVG